MTVGCVPLAMASTVSLREFLERLQQTHPMFEREELAADITREQRAGLRGAEDWNVSSSALLSHDEPSIPAFGPERTDALQVNGGIDRLFWRTGGQLGASFSSSLVDLKVDPYLGIPESYIENRLAVTYRHPLKRNKGGFLSRLDYELQQFDIDISEVSSEENQEDFLAASAARFLEWVYFTEQRRILEERLGLAEEELSHVKNRRGANLVDEVDVIRAEDAVRIVRQNLLLTETAWKAVQAELSVLVQDTAYLSMDPDYDLYATRSQPSLVDAVAELKEQSRLLRAIALGRSQLIVAGAGFRELEKPELSLVAQLGLKRADEQFPDALLLNKPEARLGLQLGFPAGNRTARARVAENRLRVRQLDRHLETVTLELSAALANLLTQLQSLEAVLALNLEQIESARRKTAEERMLYDQGRGELTFVIQSRDSEQAAKLTYAANALMYHQIAVELDALMDRLIEGEQ